jgi:FkbM family methyltransferase
MARCVLHKFKIRIFTQGADVELAVPDTSGTEFFVNMDAIRSMQEIIEGDSLIMSRRAFSYIVVMRKLARCIIYLVPGKLLITKLGARLPPFLRTALTAKFFSVVAALCAKVPADLDTNLGIKSKLHVTVASLKASLVFGSPRLFVGERSSLELVLSLFQYSDCFLDVGSNIGLFVFYLRCRSLSSKPIYFFEPDPVLFSRLENNIAKNELKNIKGFQAAMAERTGRTIFYRNKTDDSSGTLIKEDWSQHSLEAIQVDQISFDAFVSENHLKCICAKVDVEGAEEAFLTGAKSSLNNLNYLVIEILGPAIRRGLAPRIIREGKFRAYYINDFTLEHSPSGQFTYVAPFYNWLFCREDPTSLRQKLLGTQFRVVG